MNRIVVTGIGAVSACGLGAAALWDAARAGRSCVSTLNFARLRRQSVRQAAQISETDYRSAAEGARPSLQDRVAILALAAAREAVVMAGLGVQDFGARCGVVVGSGFGGAETLDRNYFRYIEEPEARLDPMSVPKTMANSPASWVAMEHGARGALYCISTACASATQSIGLAADLIRAGRVERCLAGGTEALLVDGAFAGWEALHVMTPTFCRPFSRGRNGMVLGEGAGIVVLESLEAARARGATILAELAGYGCSSDAGDLLRPDPSGAADAMRQALEAAGLSSEAVGYVNAHGTGTVANDIAEAEALRLVFGTARENLLVSSTKPVHGHALGAAGALEFIVALAALRDQIAPPTLNFIDVDPKIGFAPVQYEAQPFRARAVMSNSFAFGGVNASLVLIMAGASD